MGGTDYRAFRQAARKLRQMADRAENVTPAWPHVGSYLSKTANRQWATRGAWLGTKWKPLAASTRAEKRRLGFPAIPLQRTKTLRRQFTKRPMRDEVYTPKSAFFGSSSDLARWQARGTYRNGKRHIPPRPILIATERERHEIKGILTRYVVGGRKAIGRVRVTTPRKKK